MVLKVGGVVFDYWNEFKLNLAYDAVCSTFSFKMYFDPTNLDHRRIMEPGIYNTVQLYENGELLLTGTILQRTMKDGAVKEYSELAGYSLTGILEDCNLPVSSYPIQFDKLSLREIAAKVLAPFQIGFVVDDSVSEPMDGIYDTTKIETTKTIKEFLSELASQKYIIISHLPEGQLLFTRGDITKQPVLNFDASTGPIPGTSFSLSFNGQGMHNTITVLQQPNLDDTNNSTEGVINNPYVNITRPKVTVQNADSEILEYISTIQPGQIEIPITTTAAKMALGMELKGLRVTINTHNWIGSNGKILRPGDIVTITNPQIFLFNKTKFTIDSINFTGNPKETVATLNCVVPEVFTLDLPGNIFI